MKPEEVENKASGEGSQPLENANTEAGDAIQLTDQQQTINELTEKLSEANDKHIRLYSEFDNFRKRTAKERLEFLKVAGEDILQSFLPVMDDLERALKSNETATDINAVKEGVNLIFNKLKNTLTQKGIEPMVSAGETFNADLHEAITNVPAANEKMKGKVIEEVEKGYYMNGKVIRFAKVVVGN